MQPQTRARATREADERLLAMLRFRDLGLNSQQIGRRFGLRQNVVRTLFQRIDRDLSKSEEEA
jgi:hypothetical protein